MEFTFEFVMCDAIARPVTLWANADDRYMISFNNGAPLTPTCNPCWGSVQTGTFTAQGAPFANTVRFHVHNDASTYNGVQPAMVQWKLFY